MSQPVDTPINVVPSPLDMPGANKAIPPATVDLATTSQPEIAEADHVEPKAAVPESKSDLGDTVELERFKAIQKIARDLEKTAKANQSDAERYRQIVEQISGGSGDATPDPLAQIEQLRKDVESERTERLREQVARTTGVPPSQITGTDEASMTDSAQKALTWAKEIFRQAGIPLTAPAANVTSADAPGQKPVQISTRDQLKDMSSQQILAAYKDGRLDSLMGK